MCRELYKVRYVCDRRRVSRERLVMRGLNYVFRLLLLLLRSEYGFFFVIYEAEHTTHTNFEYDASQPHNLSAVSRRNNPAIVGSIVKRHAFFCTTKESLGGDECPVLALKPASSTTELSKVSYVTYCKILSNERRVAVPLRNCFR